jgi:hypothetical protein
MSPRWGSTPRLTDWLSVSRNVTFTLTLFLPTCRYTMQKNAICGVQNQWWGTYSSHRWEDWLIKGFENVQCTKNNTDRNWHEFSRHRVSTVNIYSHGIKKRRENVWAALNAANYAMTSVQENVMTGLTSPAVTVLTNTVSHMTSNSVWLNLLLTSNLLKQFYFSYVLSSIDFPSFLWVFNSSYYISILL